MNSLATDQPRTLIGPGPWQGLAAAPQDILDPETAAMDAFLKQSGLAWPQIHEPGGRDSRLADEFVLDSGAGTGTCVQVTKWPR